MRFLPLISGLLVTFSLLAPSAQASMKLVVLKKGDIRHSSLNEVSREVQFKNMGKPQSDGKGGYWTQTAQGKLCLAGPKEPEARRHYAMCEAALVVKNVLQLNDISIDVTYTDETGSADAENYRYAYIKGRTQNTRISTITPSDEAKLKLTDFSDKSRELLSLVYDVNAGTELLDQWGPVLKEIRLYVDSSTGKVLKWETTQVPAPRR